MRGGTTRRRAHATAVAAAALCAGGCSPTPAGDTASSPSTPVPTSSAAPRSSSTPSHSAEHTPAPVPGTAPPAWLGTRPLPVTDTGYGEVRPTPIALRRRAFTLPDRLRPLPGSGFAAEITSPAPREVIARSTWHPGCPVAADRLTWIRLTFWGFDDRRHTGELLVGTDAARPIVSVFRRLYQQRFPFEELRVTTAAELAAPPTGDGNNTESFVCRKSTGSAAFSEHAYGRAIDIDPFQNPYHRGEIVLPELASSYLHRDRLRPGMVTPDGPVDDAFAAIGWRWGGTWQQSVDYQHFSVSGR